MKQFTKLYSDFWTNYDNAEVVSLGIDAQLMALYLQGNSHNNMLGVYYLPILYMASDLRLPVERVQISLKKLCRINYCKYDDKTQHIWVCNLAFDQIGKNISNKDNRIKAIHAIWDSLPLQLKFLEEIYQKYGAPFHFEPRIFERSPKKEAYKTEKLEKLGSEVAVKDVSSSINTNKGIDISVSSDIDTATEAQHFAKLPSNSTTSTTFEAPSKGFSYDSGGFEEPYQDIKVGKSNVDFENDYENDSSVTLPEPPETFLEAPLGTKTPPANPINTYVVSGASLENENVERSKINEIKKQDGDALSPSEPLQIPFKGGYEGPSKPLLSPFEGASDHLRSNIEYRIKNIENRSKKKEEREDIYKNNVLIPNIVAFKQQTRPCVDEGSSKNKNLIETISFENSSCLANGIDDPHDDLVASPDPGDTNMVSVLSLDSKSESGSKSNSKSDVDRKPEPIAKSTKTKEKHKEKQKETQKETQDSKAVYGKNNKSNKSNECGEESRENKKENEEKNKGKSKEKSIVRANASKVDDRVITIFEHWKNVMQHPRSKLDRKRKVLIQKALQTGYSAQELCHAITGCSLTGHNIGKNDRGQRYDGLHVILRDADQIDRFIYNCHHPPKPQTKAHARLGSNLNVANDWVRAKLSN